jgi:hypothetical protein
VLRDKMLPLILQDLVHSWPVAISAIQTEYLYVFLGRTANITGK